MLPRSLLLGIVSWLFSAYGDVEYYVAPSNFSQYCPQGKPCFTLNHFTLNTSLLSNQGSASLLFITSYIHGVEADITIVNTTELKFSAYCSHSSCSQSAVVYFKGLNFVLKNVSVFRMEKLYWLGMLYPKFLLAANTVFSEVGFDSLHLHLVGKNSTIVDSRLYRVDIHFCPLAMEKSASSVIFHSTIFRSCLLGLFSYNDKCTTFPDHLDISFFNSSFRGLDHIFINFFIQSKSNFALRLHVNNCFIEGGLRTIFNCLNSTFHLCFYNTTVSGQRNVVHIEFGGMNNQMSAIFNNVSTANHQYGSSKVTVIEVQQLPAIKCNARIQISNSLFNDSSVALSFESLFDQQNLLRTSVYVYIENSIFSFQQIVAIRLTIAKFKNIYIKLVISQSYFNRNCKVLDVTQVESHSQILPSQEISSPIVFVSLGYTEVQNSYSKSWPESGIVKVQEARRLLLRNCKFINNSGTGLLVYNSYLFLGGNTLFSNNKGIKGGALALYKSRIYFFENNSKTVFLDNFAEFVGGAIFIQRQGQNYHLCFFQIYPQVRVNVTFARNFAKSGGDDIYGGSILRKCTILNSQPLVGASYDNNHQLQQNFHSNTSSTSSVTSDPTRVCLCDSQGRPRCADLEYIYRELPSVYPGEEFFVSAVTVGFDFGSVPGNVYVDVTANHTALASNQYVQNSESFRKCIPLKFVLNSPYTNHTVKIKLYNRILYYRLRGLLASIYWYRTHHLILEELLFHPVYLQVSLEECPLGFQLSLAPPHACICHHKLHENGIDCSINNHTGLVYRFGNIWISSVPDSSGLVVHLACPYDYCKPDNLSIDLLYPDVQCSFNRVGVLCGACPTNLSLALGSSKCLQCDNRFVFLLLLFFLAGLALVFFIKVLDLTVARGTMNGLILYSNIVCVNRSIFFYQMETFPRIQQFLQVFISWLNLDLGIETCFINGLNGYWKTWLQFAFPLYVWSIAGAMIISARYSTRAGRLFGNNSVPVLATLILLSYTKLLRTLIVSFGFSVLDYPQGPRVVWSFDGNVPFFGAAHSILFLVSLSVLLFLWLPYTLILLTLQWLRRKSNLKLLRWINRLKPFFDAYVGRLKPAHQYWVGLLLLVRMFLLVLFTSTSTVAPRVSIAAILVTCMALFLYRVYSGSVYKSLALSLLEDSFTINLAILAVATLYKSDSAKSDVAVVYTSIGLVLLEFLGIVAYHIFSAVRSTLSTLKRRRGNQSGTGGDIRPSTAHLRMQYREPLLDSVEQAACSAVN